MTIQDIYTELNEEYKQIDSQIDFLIKISDAKIIKNVCTNFAYSNINALINNLTEIYNLATTLGFSKLSNNCTEFINYLVHNDMINPKLFYNTVISYRKVKKYTDIFLKQADLLL